MLLKRVRVANVAPFLFLGYTPFLLFIFLATPLDVTYAQDDSGEIFWGEDEEEDEEFFEEDEEFLEDDEEFDEDPDAFFDEEEGEDEFVDEGEFEEEEFDEGELSSTELSDEALKIGYTLTLHGASPGWSVIRFIPTIPLPISGSELRCRC